MSDKDMAAHLAGKLAERDAGAVAGSDDFTMEMIFESWDGCDYDGIDIGAALRADFAKIDSRIPADGISLREIWEAADGNPDVKPNKELLLAAIRTPAAAASASPVAQPLAPSGAENGQDGYVCPAGKAQALAAQPLTGQDLQAVDRECGAAVGWNDALAEVRATVAEMQNNLEAFGEYSQGTARRVIDGVLDSIDELIAQPYESAELCGYALVPLRVTKEMQDAWDGTPDNEDNDVLFAHAYSRMIAASIKAPIPRWDQLVNWYGDQPAITLIVEGMKAENAALRAALTLKDSHAS